VDDGAAEAVSVAQCVAPALERGHKARRATAGGRPLTKRPVVKRV
jgi:hypothetical protein